MLFKRQKSLALLVASTAALIGANSGLTAGFSRASASVVASINTINPLFTLVFVVVLQKLGFEQFEEKLTVREIAVKAAATVLFVTGIYLVR